MSGHERSDALVLFGATGDLAHKKIFPSLYAMAVDGLLEVPVIGVASSAGDDEFLRDKVRASLAEQVDDAEADVVEQLLSQVRYVSGDYREPAVFDELGPANTSMLPGSTPRATTSCTASSWRPYLACASASSPAGTR